MTRTCAKTKRAQKPKPVPYEKAVEMMAGNRLMVHVFVNASFAIVGFDMKKAELRALMEKNGVVEAGPAASRLNHSIAVREDDGRYLFIETKKEEPCATGRKTKAT